VLALLIHSLWAGVAVYAIRQAAAVALRFAPATAEALLPPAPVEVPNDLQAVAMQEQAAWAQEEVLRAIRERYEELKDWNKVRSAFGIGQLD